jgi:hypothetical protein
MKNKRGGGAEIQPHVYINSTSSGSDQFQAPAGLPQAKSPSVTNGEEAEWVREPFWRGLSETDREL